MYLNFYFKKNLRKPSQALLLERKLGGWGGRGKEREKEREKERVICIKYARDKTGKLGRQERT